MNRTNINVMQSYKTLLMTVHVRRLRESYILGWIESLQAVTHPVLIVFTRVPAESNVLGAD
jgi:hypothetical protein